MKNGAAVVVGALVMFVSGYFLGYTTAVPDILRASALGDGQDDLGLGDGVVMDITEEFKNENSEDSAPIDDSNLVPSTDEMPGDDNMGALELDQLKRMIVPLLTDEEIKKIRAEAAAASQAPEPDTGSESPELEEPAAP